MEIFHTIPFFGVLRIGHIFAAIMWMGLLWFFNFVQTPAYAEMEPPARNSAFDKLTWRALWWFRWAAVATVAMGLLLLAVGAMSDSIGLYKDGDYWMKTASGPTLGVAIVMGFIMLANVWMVIWPNQQVVIANARTLLAGGEANPDAAASARAGAMASRQNTVFSIPVLSFMVMAGHFWGAGDTQRFAFSSGKAVVFYLIALAIIGVLEANALGKISGRGNGGLNVIYESHINALYAGIGIFVFLYVLADILLRN